MEISCPHCDATLKASQEYLGKRVKCSRCKRIFLVAKPPLKEDTLISSKREFSQNVGKKTGRVQQDITSKEHRFEKQADVCARCARAIDTSTHEFEGRLFCIACEQELSEQTTSRRQQEAGVTGEIQVKCRLCRSMYTPDLKTNKAWMCPNCQGKNPNLKRHYRSVADVCILGLISTVLLLYAELARGRIGLGSILGLVHAVFLLATIICTYRSVAPWIEESVKILIVVVFGVASLTNIGFLLVLTPWVFSVPVAGVYAIIWAFLLWLWIQTKLAAV